jgi:hypothetical protein
MIQLILAFALNFIQPDAPACSCSYMGPFLEMTKNAELVVLIRVNKYNNFVTRQDSTKMPLSIEAEIIDTYKGSEPQKTVTIWGDNGMLCRPYIFTFKENQYYVMAVSKLTKMRRMPNEKVDDYAISGCGAYWLNADWQKKSATGHVEGKEAKTSSTILLQQLKQRVQEPAPTANITP